MVTVSVADFTVNVLFGVATGFTWDSTASVCYGEDGVTVITTISNPAFIADIIIANQFDRERACEETTLLTPSPHLDMKNTGATGHTWFDAVCKVRGVGRVG